MLKANSLSKRESDNWPDFLLSLTRPPARLQTFSEVQRTSRGMDGRGAGGRRLSCQQR